jgi:multicomponent Na+:H+ antiporter subunit D
MNWDSSLLLLILATSLVPGLVIFFLPEERVAIRTTLNMAGALVKLVLVGVVIWGVLHGHQYETRLPLLPGGGFFSLCVTATVGVALAGNLITFLLFYELLTLSTYPLIVHRGTEEARQAGRIYLRYTIAGGALLLVGTVWLYDVAGSLEFTHRGVVAGLGDSDRAALTAIFVLLHRAGGR